MRRFQRQPGGAEDEDVLTRLTLALALDLAVRLRFLFSTFFKIQIKEGRHEREDERLI